MYRPESIEQRNADIRRVLRDIGPCGVKQMASLFGVDQQDLRATIQVLPHEYRPALTSIGAIATKHGALELHETLIDVISAAHDILLRLAEHYVPDEAVDEALES